MVGADGKGATVNHALELALVLAKWQIVHDRMAADAVLGRGMCRSDLARLRVLSSLLAYHATMAPAK